MLVISSTMAKAALLASEAARGRARGADCMAASSGSSGGAADRRATTSTACGWVLIKYWI